jgi:hypothetical protein
LFNLFSIFVNVITWNGFGEADNNKFCLFWFDKKKVEGKKLQKPMNELEHKVSPSSFIDFHNFLLFHFLSIKSNTPPFFILIGRNLWLGTTLNNFHLG